MWALAHMFLRAETAALAAGLLLSAVRTGSVAPAPPSAMVPAKKRGSARFLGAHFASGRPSARLAARCAPDSISRTQKTAVAGLAGARPPVWRALGHRFGGALGHRFGGALSRRFGGRSLAGGRFAGAQSPAAERSAVGCGALSCRPRPCRPARTPATLLRTSRPGRGARRGYRPRPPVRGRGR
jgi:hypothetical protein